LFRTKQIKMGNSCASARSTSGDENYNSKRMTFDEILKMNQRDVDEVKKNED